MPKIKIKRSTWAVLLPKKKYAFSKFPAISNVRFLHVRFAGIVFAAWKPCKNRSIQESEAQH
jgi:hypothetical protein